MAVSPPSSLPDLLQHLSEVTNSPNTNLDAKLFDKVEAQLTGQSQRYLLPSTRPVESMLTDMYSVTEQNIPPLIPTLLPQLTSTIPLIKQDPKPVTTLIIALLRSVPFTSCLTFTSPTSLVEALNSSSPPVNILALSLLEKAAVNPSDTAIVAGMKEVVSELVTLWLCTSDTEVSQKAARVLENLLKVDHGTSDSGDIDVDMEDADKSGERNGRGQGLMWRRIFGDRDIYSLFFSICSPKATGRGERQLSKSERSLSQARLLSLLEKLAAMDFGTLTHSHHPDLEASYGLQSDREGFLDFAIVHMVNAKEDVLMHMALIDTLVELLKAVPPSDATSSSSIASLSLSPSSSSPLDFLISRGIHDRTSNYYLEPTLEGLGPSDAAFLSGRAAAYLAAYASRYPSHLLTAVRARTNTSVLDAILSRISQGLAGRSARQDPPSHDLHLLASLPRATLLPRIRPNAPSTPQDLWRSSPVCLIPLKRTSSEYLNTLATLFHGPSQATGEVTINPSPSTEPPRRPPTLVSEAAAARVLYTLYLAKEPHFYRALVSYAGTVALRETAVAALNLLSAIITANWEPLPSPGQGNSADSTALLTEYQLISMLPPSAPRPPPPSSLQAILREPVIGIVGPYLLAPAQVYSNLVGGRGDTESAAYKVAIAKYGATKRLFDVLKRNPSTQGSQLTYLLSEVVAKGPWPSASRPGARVSVMGL
ncbi:hypothetical protein GP486_003776 [Trichoglossum hirsutum]|uniref:DNA mismatch repair protein HSM3 N-terminal domain-containing protein n=1 Tax=Trichoglossum hirsutum TaxID=265104 RepID=A0A9P8LCE1_9PEZI|nr:hypothetical protein GP486_003776 [Trichoglossum hirsutum]